MSVIALSRARIGSDAGILEAIHDRDVALAIWERDTPSAIAHLLSAPIGNIRFATTLAWLPQRLGQALDAAGFPTMGARVILETDIIALANRFAFVMATDAVDIRLDRIATNACRKFHADYVRARLITTYAGPGTQWLDDEAPGGGVEPRDVRQLRSGDVAIFKGRHWDEARAAIHRSPPIEGTGAERLVLVINPVERMSA